ncbi:hypothetical protein JW921_11075 [Candidatus Fermentibacterales bacterium]|nr:hypothetical protein [Candidatus Fermentibacterales bacterium]
MPTWTVYVRLAYFGHEEIEAETPEEAREAVRELYGNAVDELAVVDDEGRKVL